MACAVWLIFPSSFSRCPFRYEFLGIALTGRYIGQRLSFVPFRGMIPGVPARWFCPNNGVLWSRCIRYSSSNAGCVPASRPGYRPWCPARHSGRLSPYGSLSGLAERPRGRLSPRRCACPGTICPWLLPAGRGLQGILCNRFRRNQKGSQGLAGSFPCSWHTSTFLPGDTAIWQP